jgi:hypothetical protein
VDLSGKDIMTLAEILHKEGRAEGELEGRVEMIVALYEKGVLAAATACIELKTLAKRKNVPAALIKNALARIEA